MKYYAILDIGKTHVKFQVINEASETLINVDRKNKVIQSELYPHIDIDEIWLWFINQAKNISNVYEISAINISSHGATAAIVNGTSEYGSSGLIFPVMDYEWTGVSVYDEAYLQVRPSFSETYSPSLPGGLNLGRQLFWMHEAYPQKFSNDLVILLYPQYWSWRMTGKLATEITSLGSHTDLWDIELNDFSSLAKKMGWQKYFPALHKADLPLSNISEAFSNETGINKKCLVYPGLHDSNASYLRYMDAKGKVNETIISSGTWAVSFSPSSSIKQLSEIHDMLANVDIHGNAICCARFMGGREFEEICRILSSSPDADVSESDIQALINQNVMALPNFSGGSGPFSKRKSSIIGLPENGTALATLYVALMIHYELELLKSDTNIIIEGAFAKNILLCSVVAQLRNSVSVSASMDVTGAISGAASLCASKNSRNTNPVKTYISNPTGLTGLLEYYQQWKIKSLS